MSPTASGTQARPENPSQKTPERIEEFSLNPKGAHKRLLEKDVIHRYGLKLRAGQFLHVIVMQEGVDLEVHLKGPDGKKLFEVDSPNYDKGPEEVLLYADSSGMYWLELDSTSYSAGTYKIQLQALRPASSWDRINAQAEKIFHEAREIRKQYPDWAVEQFLKADKLWRQTENSLRRANVFERLYEIYSSYNPRQWERSSKYSSLALDFYRAAGDRLGECRMLNALGVVQRQLKRNDLAEKNYAKALRIAKEEEFAEQEATALLNLGILYRDRREYWKALDLAEKSLPLWRRERNQHKLVDALITRGLVYLALGKYQSAIDSYNEALKVLGPTDNSDLRGRTLDRISELYRSRGEIHRNKEDLRTALAYAKSALAYRQETGDSRGLAVSSTVMGAILESLGDRFQARQRQDQALTIFHQIGDTSGEASALVNIGNLLIDSDLSGAIKRFEQGASLARQHDLKEVEFKALFGMALAERRRGNPITAKRRAKEALALADSLETDTVSRDELTTPYEALRQDCARLLVDLLIKQPSSYTSREDLIEAFEVIERRRQHNLWSSLTPSRIREGYLRRADPSLQAELRKLEEEITGAEQERRRLELAGESSSALDETLKALIEKLQTLDSQIRLKDPWISSSARSSLVDLKETQEILGQGRALLQYELGESRSFLGLVTASSLEVYELPSRSKIEGLARDFYERISRSQSQKELERARNLAHEMSNMLLGPVANQLRSYDLVIVPDGQLNYIPFGLLPDPAGKAANWKNSWPTPLFFRHVISFLPSVSVLKAVRAEDSRKRAPSGLLAVFAAPVFTDRGLPRLPHSRDEAEKILALFPPKLRFAALDRRATRDLARSGVLENYGIIHFATHAINHPDHPELASIMLSQINVKGKQINGRLSQLDIQDLHLNADLVVLSACKTALGNQIPGEGVVGLGQGFLYAGASSVVASLWNINDESTPAFMEIFYQALQKGQPPAKALNTAQIWMAQNQHRKQSWSSPYHWGAFQIQGDWQ